MIKNVLGLVGSFLLGAMVEALKTKYDLFLNNCCVQELLLALGVILVLMLLTVPSSSTLQPVICQSRGAYHLFF